MSDTTVLAGLIVSSVVAGLSLVKYAYQVYIDNDKYASKMKLCRRSSKMLAMASVGAAAILSSHMAAYYGQGFWLRSDGVEVFWARYPAYAIATGALFQILGRLAWVDSATRNISSLFGISFWVVAGVFGTLSPYPHNWWYFAAAIAPLVVAFFSYFVAHKRVDHIVKSKCLWSLAGMGALALVWGLSPAGSDVISLESAYLGFVITEALVFFAVYAGSIFYFVSPSDASAPLLAVRRRKAKHSDVEDPLSSSGSESEYESSSSSDSSDSSDSD